MARSNDMVLKTMQSAACAKDIYLDYPAYIAVQLSLVYWRNFDYCKHDCRAYFFSQMIMSPINFGMPDCVLALRLHVCERTLRNYRTDFKRQFEKDYNRLKNLTRRELDAVCTSLPVLLR